MTVLNEKLSSYQSLKRTDIRDEVLDHFRVMYVAKTPHGIADDLVERCVGVVDAVLGQVLEIEPASNRPLSLSSAKNSEKRFKN